MRKYRLSKFNPIFRTADGKYSQKTWTSYSDIGQKYGGKLFPKEEYLATEAQYIEAILFVMRYLQVSCVRIVDLERALSQKKIEFLLSKKGLSLTPADKKVLATLTENEEIPSEELEIYLKLILRDCFWCRLETNDLQFIVEFGYDFYVYITCSCINKNIIKSFSRKGIYIELMTPKKG